MAFYAISEPEKPYIREFSLTTKNSVSLYFELPHIGLITSLEIPLESFWDKVI